MERRNAQLVQDTITGFVPAAFLTMTLIDVWQRRGQIQQMHWGVFFVELILMASGFVPAVLLITSARSTPNRWRISISGVVAVFLLGFLSVFIKRASIGTIIVASIFAGVFSALGTWEPRVRSNGELPENGVKNLTLYLTLLTCTVTAILFTLARYVLVVRSHGLEVNLSDRLGYAIFVSVAPALGVLFLVKRGWLSASWKRTVSVYALSFILIFALQFSAAMIRGR